MLNEEGKEMHDRWQQRRFVFASNGHGAVVEVDREKGNACMVRENYCIRADAVLMDSRGPWGMVGI